MTEKNANLVIKSLILLSVLFLNGLASLLFMFLFNYSISSYFNMREINFIESACLYFLIKFMLENPLSRLNIDIEKDDK